jgi:L-lactate dehydrogenase complex protein LldG
VMWMKSSELETMRKTFNTVKSRSSEIKDSPQVKRLESKVREIKKYSIENSKELYDQVIESFGRNGIDVEFAKTKDDAILIIEGRDGDERQAGNGIGVPIIV